MKKIILLIFLSFYSFVQAQTWNEQLVNPGTVLGPECMLYDKSGNPVVLYSALNYPMFSHWNGTSWTTSIISTSTSSIYSLGGVRVEDRFFVYQEFYGGGSTDYLQMYEIDTSGNVANTYSFGYSSGYKGCSICYDETSNKLFLSYSSQNGSANLMVCIFDIAAQSWSEYFLVDGSNSVGNYNDIAIDQSGQIWISYKDEYGRNLKVARSKNTDYNEWDIWFVDTEGNVGDYSQIYVDGSNVAHIAYYDATNQKLKYARFNP